KSSERNHIHKLKVKVKRPGLHVSYRTSFYGVSDEDKPGPVLRTRAEQMLNAVVSPFGSNDVDLRLTPIFMYEEKGGPILRTLIHIDAGAFTFVDEDAGRHKADFDILAVTYGENGRVIDQVNRTHTIHAGGDIYDRILKEGFAYVIDIPVKNPG